MEQGIYASLTNTEYTNNVVDFVKGRGKLYKVKITANVENAIIKMDGVIKNFGMYIEGATINAEISADGYQTQTKQITVAKADVNESITLTANGRSRKVNETEEQG